MLKQSVENLSTKQLSFVCASTKLVNLTVPNFNCVPLCCTQQRVRLNTVTVWRVLQIQAASPCFKYKVDMLERDLTTTVLQAAMING